MNRERGERATTADESGTHVTTADVKRETHDAVTSDPSETPSTTGRTEASGKPSIITIKMVERIPVATDASPESVVRRLRPKTYYTCGRCSKVYSHVWNVRRHVNKTPRCTGPNPAKTWPCPMCPKALSSRAYLKVHMMQHTGERPYSCPLCVGEFTYQFSLKRHMEAKHPVRKRPDASASSGCATCARCYSGKPQTCSSTEYRCIVCPAKSKTL